MKKAILIELAWLVGLFVIAYLLCAFFISNSALDVRAFDTYQSDGDRFSFRAPIVFTGFLSLSFLAYLLRAVFLKFRMRRICIMLIIFTLLLLFIMECLSYSQYNELDDLSLLLQNQNKETPVVGLFYGGDSSMFSVRFLLCSRIFLTLVIVFTAFMTGRLYRKNS